MQALGSGGRASSNAGEVRPAAVALVGKLER
jgi:hypothetical protein